jgi:peptidoglycan/xylan/chitin deacetylase (PgdA/CDA1 family)
MRLLDGPAASRLPYVLEPMEDLLILCYHAISPSWPAALSVTPELFERQLDALVQRGYQSARLTEAVIGEVGPRVAVITFDDGYRSVLELAKPILDRYGFSATLYVPTAWPDEPRVMRWPGIDRWLGTVHEEEMRSVTWSELRTLDREGWEIGSHTCTHPRLPTLEDSALIEELSHSKARIEDELGHACTSLAYPYGGVDARVVEATRAAGYSAATTIPRILRREEPLSWPRVPIFHEDGESRFRLKISPTVRRLRRSPLGVALDRMRVAVSDRGQASGEPAPRVQLGN